MNKMKDLFVYCSLLYFSHLPVSLAGKNNLVHSGLDLKAAFEKAEELCPEKLIGKRYGRKAVYSKIQGLMAPSREAKNPERNTYIQSYIPNEAEIQKSFQEFCGFPSFSSIEESGLIKAEKVVEDLSHPSNLLSNTDFQPESITEETNLNYQNLFVFFLGLVIGMLFVFVYNSRLQVLPVNASKSLRRPEL